MIKCIFMKCQGSKLMVALQANASGFTDLLPKFLAGKNLLVKEKHIFSPILK